jgi:hypothetical protein
MPKKIGMTGGEADDYIFDRFIVRFLYRNSFSSLLKI